MQMLNAVARHSVRVNPVPRIWIRQGQYILSEHLYTQTNGLPCNLKRVVPHFVTRLVQYNLQQFLALKKMNCLSRLITKWALFLYIAAIFSMCTNIKSVIFRNVFIHVRNILLVANISKRYVIVSLVDFFYLCASIHSCIWKCQVYKQKQ